VSKGLKQVIPLQLPRTLTFAIAIVAVLLASQRHTRPGGWGRGSHFLLWVLLPLGLLGGSGSGDTARLVDVGGRPVLGVSDVEEKVGLLGQDTGQAHLG